MSFLSYVFGPRLYMEYGVGAQKMYEARGLEKFGDQVLSMLSVLWNLSCYSSPLIVTVLYRRGYLVMDSLSSLAKFSTSIGLIVVISLCVRGFGRSQSRSYTKMIKALELSKSVKSSEEGKRALRRFDFEFAAWQVDFDVASVQSEGKGKPLRYSTGRDGRPLRLAALPCELAAYIAIHTFGIRMIYPGSIRLLQSYMRPMLVSGRAKLIEEHNATRYKVKTIDKNEIDTIFVDNRNIAANGKTLVICSEGNAGFYEIGIVGIPIEQQYSVLGWNHPGFEGSTGMPYPDQDKNAIEAVVQFAIDHLKFAVEDIILYGWSIGGFSTLWAATCYPDVKGVVLDATFDDVLHLAQPRMPAALSGVVKIAIRDYCNLNLVELLPNYNGPMLMIRRTEDEIIAEDNRIETNRGNFLALALFKYRYPNIFKPPQLSLIKDILTRPLETKSFNTSEDNRCMSRLVTYASDQGKVFPMQIGEDYSDMVRTHMAEFLLRKHFRDYASTHCTPLPPQYFTIPWDIPIEQGFVLT